MTIKFESSQYRVTMKQKDYEVQARDARRMIYEVSRNGQPYTLRKKGSFYELIGEGEVVCRSMTIQFKRARLQPPAPVA